MARSAESTNKVSDANVRSVSENKKNCTHLERTSFLEYADALPFKSDGLFIAPIEDMQSVSGNAESASVTEDVLHGCNNEKTNVKDGNSGNGENSSVQKYSIDLSKSVMDKTDESDNEVEDMVHSVDGTELDNGKTSEMEERMCKEGKIEVSPKVILAGDDSTNKALSFVCNRHLKNEEPLSSDGPKAVSAGQDESFYEGVDCCTVNEYEDHLRNKLDGKDGSISSVEAHSTSTICENPDPEEKNPITDCHQAQSHDRLPQMEHKQDASHDAPSTEGRALTVEHTTSKILPQSPSEVEPVPDEAVIDEKSKTDMCLTDEEDFQKPALPWNESSSSFDESCLEESSQAKDSLEAESKQVEWADFDPITDQETKSVNQEENNDVTTQNEPFPHQSHSPPKCESEETLAEETNLKMDKPNEAYVKSYSGVVIPFIEKDISDEDIVRPHVKEELVLVQNNITSINETTSPDFHTEASSICLHNEKKELSAGEINDLTESNQPVVLGTESDQRCPTPTMDEKPYEFILYSGCSSNTCKNPTQKCDNRNTTPVEDEMPLEQKRCLESTVNKEPSTHGLPPDLELRTLRVLQSIKFLCKSNQTGHMETSVTKLSVDQNPSPSRTDFPSCLSLNHTSADFKNKKTSTKSAAAPASTSELHKESSEHFNLLPFKSKLEEVLGVKLKLNKTNSSVSQNYCEREGMLQEMPVDQDHCHSLTSFSFEVPQAIKPKMDQNKQKLSQPSSNYELPSCSQRPVMAVKPSKSDESQADSICKDEQTENLPTCKQTKTSAATFTTAASTERTERHENSEGLYDDMHLISGLSSRNCWTSSVSNDKTHLNKSKFAHLDTGDISKFSALSSQSTQSLTFQSTERSKLGDKNQGYLTHSLVEKVPHTAKANASDPPAPFLDSRNNSTVDDNLTLGPECSLMCTVYNTSRKRCYSFLEQVSKRCLQDDLTQASMEQEHLIFHEQMKQLLKKSKRARICQQDAQDRLPFVSPVTVNFSSLEEQQDLLYHLDAPSLVGQKIEVDMSDRKGLVDATKERTVGPQGTGKPLEHAGVSTVTEECARLYETMMNNVCSVKKVPSRSRHFCLNTGNPRTDSCNHFDFCDQMKREMDESFHSKLNSVVKKSSKTKYRFYILVTSDDVFFEETKVR